MAFKYYSREWCDEAQRRINSDAEHLAAARNLTGTFCFRVYDCPDGTDRLAYWDFDQGRLLNVSLEIKPAPDEEIRGLPYDKTKIRARTSTPLPAWRSRASTRYGAGDTPATWNSATRGSSGP